MKRLTAALSAATAAALVITSGAAPAQAVHVDPSYLRERTALAVVHPDGRISMSADGEEPRPALSLAKLYLGYYVLYHGTSEEKDQVEKMIASSNDAIAGKLDRAYPEAIDEIASDFDLTSTARAGGWGKTQTSARDIATFISEILWDPVAKPLFSGMEHQDSVAADGFIQGFGTARIEDAEGSKMGWTDDRTSGTGSVSWGKTGGDTWVASALTYGNAYQNTVDVRNGIKEVDDSPKKKERS
ncbi:hypothetical protein V6D40_09250 [Corynebacterium sp. Q4381]|uniref:hypothetical protein n=1 Tax=Corynebacterium sp. Marseille-Q4381 TaxID=3121597 RepID=UPI002FE5BBA0